MNIKNIIIAVFAMVMVAGCNGQSKNSNEQKTNSGNMSKSIVIFFSHAGDNYSVGVIDTGNTKIVADYISEITGEFSIYGHEVRSGKAKVEKWVKSIRN